MALNAPTLAQHVTESITHNKHKSPNVVPTDTPAVPCWNFLPLVTHESCLFLFRLRREYASFASRDEPCPPEHVVSFYAPFAWVSYSVDSLLGVFTVDPSETNDTGSVSASNRSLR